MNPRGGLIRGLREAGTLGEWLLGGFSALAVLAVAAILLYQGLSRDPEGPAIRVRVEGVRAVSDSLWVVEFIAENTGGAPALDVAIEGRLGPVDGLADRAAASIELIPEGAQRRGGLQFRLNPAAHGLEVRATGWTRP